MVRAFIGVVAPEDVKKAIANIQQQLRLLPIKAKFVELGNLHISLSFLGDIGDAEIERIKILLDKIASSYSKFEVILNGIALIPNERFVRVIAIDVKNQILESLRKDVVKSIGGESHPAHLTLGRIKSIDDKDRFRENISMIKYSDIHVEIDAICLIKSSLNGDGPLYTVLHKSHLK